MPSGRCANLADLPQAAATVIEEARRAVLATLDPSGRPHAVPVCFVVRGAEIVTPIDAKPKGTPTLGRRRNIELDPRATFLVDRWSEDWDHLGWVMIRGTARLDSEVPIAALTERYPQYADVFAGNEAVVLTPETISWWFWREPGEAS